MATSVYDQSMAAFGPLNRLMAGRLDLTNQRIAQELAMQDFLRKQAAQEAQGEKSFSRYADLMREQQAARTVEAEKAFNRQAKKEEDAAKERKAQREKEEQAARDMEAARRGYPPGLTREQFVEKLAADLSPDKKTKAFLNNQKALVKLYSEIEQKSQPTEMELNAIEKRAAALAESENKANKEPKQNVDGSISLVYPENYKPKTAADFITPLANMLREGKRAALKPLLSQAEVLESKQKELSAGIQDIASLLGQQSDPATGGVPSEFNPVNEHSDPSAASVESGGQPASKMTEVDKVKAGLELMLKDRKKELNPSTPRTGPSLPLLPSDPVGVAGDYYGVGGSPISEVGNAIRGMSQRPETPLVPPSVIGSFGIPQEGQGFQPVQLQNPAYKPYTQQPLIKRIALREYALRRGFAPTEIEAVEAGVAAGDPVATARAKRLHDEMVTELQLQNSAK